MNYCGTVISRKLSKGTYLLHYCSTVISRKLSKGSYLLHYCSTVIDRKLSKGTYLSHYFRTVIDRKIRKQYKSKMFVLWAILVQICMHNFDDIPFKLVSTDVQRVRWPVLE